MPTDEDILTRKVLSDVEAERADVRDWQLEDQLSINEWVGRIKDHTLNAHALARAGVVTQQYQVFVQLAAVAVARAEQLLRIQEVQASSQPEQFS